MLRRKVTDRLLSWKNNSNKALLVTGARQIGKSYAIRAFGKATTLRILRSIYYSMSKQGMHLLAQRTPLTLSTA